MAEPTDTSPVLWRELLNRKYAPALILVSLGVWLHAADSLIVATMMPAIVREIGGEAYVAWTIALYEIGSIVIGAASGLMAMRFGIRRPMVLAALIFAAGCILSATATNMPVLLAGRLLQGFGGGGLTAMSFIAIARLFPARLTARAMAIISILWGASAFLGPLIGGLFVSYASWRMGFVFFAAQAVFLALLILFGIRIREVETPTEAGSSVPLGRLALLSFGILLIADAGIEVTLLRTPALLGLGLAVLAVFLWSDARNPANRLLPQNPFRLNNPVGAALTMILLINIGTMGLSTYGPLLMLLIHATPPIVAGYVLAAISIGWSVAAFVVSGAPEKHDRFYIAAGMVMVFLSVVGSIYALPNGPIWLIAVFAALEGIGYGTAWTFIIRRAKRLAPASEVERLSGALPTIGRLGYALGASISGILANAAGFSINGSASQTADVARVIFTGSLPFVFFGLIAMGCFVLMRNSSET